jgi:insulysin
LSSPEHWRDVIVVVYNYITVLKSSSFKPYIAEEIRQLADIRFRYKEKKRPDKYATELSELLQRPYPRERVLSAASLVWSHDAEAVRHLLDGFGPRTGRIMVMGRDMAKLTQDSGWEKEKWYGTEYKVQRLEDSVLAAAEGPNQHPELHLPHPNPFIPENLAVIESGAPTVSVATSGASRY